MKRRSQIVTTSIVSSHCREPCKPCVKEEELELYESYAKQESFFVVWAACPPLGVGLLENFQQRHPHPKCLCTHSQAAHRVGNQVFIEAPFLINGQKVSFVTKY